MSLFKLSTLHSALNNSRRAMDAFHCSMPTVGGSAMVRVACLVPLSDHHYSRVVQLRPFFRVSKTPLACGKQTPPSPFHRHSCAHAELSSVDELGAHQDVFTLHGSIWRLDLTPVCTQHVFCGVATRTLPSCDNWRWGMETRRRVGFEPIRKVTRGTQHNRHRLLRKNTLLIKRRLKAKEFYCC